MRASVEGMWRAGLPPNYARTCNGQDSHVRDRSRPAKSGFGVACALPVKGLEVTAQGGRHPFRQARLHEERLK
jgi:hypothetical protein